MVEPSYELVLKRESWPVKEMPRLNHVIYLVSSFVFLDEATFNLLAVSLILRELAKHFPFLSLGSKNNLLELFLFRFVYK